MRFYLSLATVALLGLPAFADEKMTAKEVITKGIEALGGEKAIKKYPASIIKSKGTIQIMGMEVSFTNFRQTLDPDKLKQIITVDVNGQQIAIQQIVNGDKASMTIAGNEMPLDDETKAQLVEAVVASRVTSLVPLLEEKGFEVKLLDEKGKVNDKEAYVLTVNHKNLHEMKLFFDAKTFLVTKAEKEGKNGAQESGKQEMFFSDYKKTDGVMVPMKLKILHEGKDFLEAETTEAKLVEKIDDAEFFVGK